MNAFADTQVAQPAATVLLIGVTLLVTVGLGVLTTLSTRALRAGFLPRRNPLLEPADALLRIGLILLLGGVAWWAGLSSEVLGWQAEGWQWQLPLGLVTGLLLAWALHQWGMKGNPSQGANEQGGTYHPGELIEWVIPRTGREMGLVLLALLPAALLEEILFRSLWVGAAAILAPLWLIVIVSALLFGFMHSAQGRTGVVATAATGVLLAVLFVWSGSLLLPLVAHYVANVAQIIRAAHRTIRVQRDAPSPRNLVSQDAIARAEQSDL